jgi:hypothetical protein
MAAPVPDDVPAIFYGRTVREVRRRVVIGIAVKVANLESRRPRAKECRSYQPVDLMSRLLAVRN